MDGSRDTAKPDQRQVANRYSIAETETTDAVLPTGWLSGLLQAVCARARGYRNEKNFMTMICMISSPAVAVLKSS